MKHLRIWIMNIVIRFHEIMGDTYRAVAKMFGRRGDCVVYNHYVVKSVRHYHKANEKIDDLESIKES
jgi:hypothetical protein